MPIRAPGDARAETAVASDAGPVAIGSGVGDGVGVGSGVGGGVGVGVGVGAGIAVNVTEIV
mgnify:CR=1 FL=1